MKLLHTTIGHKVLKCPECKSGELIVKYFCGNNNCLFYNINSCDDICDDMILDNNCKITGFILHCNTCGDDWA